MDLAKYRTLFVLSFTTPAFDPDVAPSFGTLLATINVALSMLSEVDIQCSDEGIQLRSVCYRSLIVFVLFVDGEEERASVLEHSLTDLIRGDSSSEVSKSPSQYLKYLDLYHTGALIQNKVAF